MHAALVCQRYRESVQKLCLTLKCVNMPKALCMEGAVAVIGFPAQLCVADDVCPYARARGPFKAKVHELLGESQFVYRVLKFSYIP